MGHGISSRELAYCGLFGAAAILLPVLFHLIHLGRVFLPMYLPLVALAFFVRPWPASVAALVAPLLSGVVTGMPPFFPPVAAVMALELAVMASLIAWTCSLWPRVNPWVVLIPALLLGRVLYVALVYAVALLIDLPAGFLAGLSLLSGWPGMVLILVVVPGVVKIGRATGTIRPTVEGMCLHD